MLQFCCKLQQTKSNQITFNDKKEAVLYQRKEKTAQIKLKGPFALPFKQWVWSSNLQRVTKKSVIPFGITLFLSGMWWRFEDVNPICRGHIGRWERGPATHLFLPPGGKNATESPAGHLGLFVILRSLRRRIFAPGAQFAVEPQKILRCRSG